jgi:NADH-quinone oxidoreductase subunit H
MDFLYNPIKVLGDLVRGLIEGIFGVGLMADIVTMALAALVLMTITAVSFMYLTYAERKIVARIQDRIGPNQAGPFGLLVPLADGVKMFTKEDTTPRAADRWIFNISPIIIAAFALTSYAVLPVSPGVVGTALNVGVMYSIAIGSGAIIAIIMAGWGSNNKYALLGAFRTVAQLVGYEVTMILNVLPVIALTGSMSLIDIVARQMGNPELGLPGIPFIIYFPLSALVFLISGIAETARSPFDLLEAESEIVAGFHTEYSGMKFAMFFLGEYVNALAVAIIFATLFLGGYAGPVLPPIVWLLIKVAAIFTIFMWLRGTLPRVRVDQMHDMNWKFFVPLSIVNLIIVLLLGKIFVPTEAMQKDIGGIVVGHPGQAAIFCITSLLTLLAGLALAARNLRTQRLADEQVRAARIAENQLAAGRATVGGK